MIRDSDGYVNVRSEPKVGDNVIAQIDSGEFVLPIEQKGNWFYSISLSRGVGGYIHKSRLYDLSNYEKIDLVYVSKDSVYVHTLYDGQSRRIEKPLCINNWLFNAFFRRFCKSNRTFRFINS